MAEVPAAVAPLLAFLARLVPPRALEELLAATPEEEDTESLAEELWEQVFALRPELFGRRRPVSLTAVGYAYLFDRQQHRDALTVLRLSASEQRARRRMRARIAGVCALEQKWRGFRHLVFEPEAEALTLTWAVSKPPPFGRAFINHPSLRGAAIYPASSVAYCRQPDIPHDPGGTAFLVSVLLHEETHLATHGDWHGPYPTAAARLNETAAVLVEWFARVALIENQEPDAGRLDQFCDSGSDEESFVRLFEVTTPGIEVVQGVLKLAVGPTMRAAYRRAERLTPGVYEWLSRLSEPEPSEIVSSNGQRQKRQGRQADPQPGGQDGVAGLPEEGQEEVRVAPA